MSVKKLINGEWVEIEPDQPPPPVIEASAIRVDESIDAERRAIVRHLDAVQAITCADDIESATEYIRAAKTAAKRIDDFFKPLVDAANKAHKALTQRRASLVDPINGEAKRVQRLCDAWLTERRQEAERARREAEDKARREAEEAALERAAMLEAAGMAASADATLQIAVDFPKEVAALSPLPTKIEGVAVRTVWDFEVTDFAALPDDYKTINERLLRTAVQTQKDRASIPGVRVFQRQQSAIRR